MSSTKMYTFIDQTEDYDDNSVLVMTKTMTLMLTMMISGAEDDIGDVFGVDDVDNDDPGVYHDNDFDDNDDSD